MAMTFNISSEHYGVFRAEINCENSGQAQEQNVYAASIVLPHKPYRTDIVRESVGVQVVGALSMKGWWRARALANIPGGDPTVDDYMLFMIMYEPVSDSGTGLNTYLGLHVDLRNHEDTIKATAYSGDWRYMDASFERHGLNLEAASRSGIFDTRVFCPPVPKKI